VVVSQRGEEKEWVDIKEGEVRDCVEKEGVFKKVS
jgi:hypothetical protein